MKLTLIVAALISGSCAQACVPVAEKRIGPGHKVQVECDQYRTGVTNKPIATLEECAILCKDSSIAGAVCSYSPSSQVCVVAKPDAPIRPSSGVFLMTPIDDKCSEELKACEDSNAKCKNDLVEVQQQLKNARDTVEKLKKEVEQANARCPTNPAQPPNNQPPPVDDNKDKPTHCGDRLYSVQKGRNQGNIPPEQCKSRCLADASCKAYSVTKLRSIWGCGLHSTPSKDLTTRYSQHHWLYDITCP